MQRINKPNFETELSFYNKKCNHFIGVDEVGRGSWAGPIVATSCWINPKYINYLPNNINDSKKLSFKDRINIYESTKEFVFFSTSVATSKEIDKHGLTNANKLAIYRSLKSIILTLNCSKKKINIFVDGNIDLNTIKKKEEKVFSFLDLNSKITSKIKGDETIISISLASIIAKVTRDHIMKQYNKLFPLYGFYSNYGYGTKYHREKLLKFGLSPIHRKTFKPMNTIC